MTSTLPRADMPRGGALQPQRRADADGSQVPRRRPLRQRAAQRPGFEGMPVLVRKTGRCSHFTRTGSA
ncbi:hypothetical protein ABZ923_33475, partial [Streptomyces sp. NPDC046881]|uniref:hypothetical protein n=1 Tax=Streptomyces sp. NPDC046881 TaxID=3155374 RepID=UPI003406C1F0